MKGLEIPMVNFFCSTGASVATGACVAGACVAGASVAGVVHAASIDTMVMTTVANKINFLVDMIIFSLRFFDLFADFLKPFDFFAAVPPY
jgi:hypothetical protein